MRQTLALQMIAVYVPFFQTFLQTEALPAKDFAVCLILSSLVFWGVEVGKWRMRWIMSARIAPLICPRHPRRPTPKEYLLRQDGVTSK